MSQATTEFAPSDQQLQVRGTASVPAGTDSKGFKLEKMFRLCRQKRRGAAVVEFAIVVPVFFLFVLGMVEYGRMIMVQQVLVNASREGARVGVLDGASAADVNTAVNNYLTGARVSGATITIVPNPPSSAAYGAPVTVTVAVPFNQVSWLPSPMFLGGQTLSSSTAMRREAVQ